VLHLNYGQYKDNHSEADRNNDPVVERVSKYIEHDLVSVIFIRKIACIYRAPNMIFFERAGIHSC
jgi:hypothetical protein